jgi:hypothetical protein
MLSSRRAGCASSTTCCSAPSPPPQAPTRCASAGTWTAVATLDELHAAPGHSLRATLPTLDAVFTYGGGPPVIDAYEAFGVRACVPNRNALDPATHHPAPPHRVSRRTSTSSPTGFPTARRASKPFSSRPPSACLITAAWEGIELYLTPDKEVLSARDGQDVADHVAASLQRAPTGLGKPRLPACSPSIFTRGEGRRWTGCSVPYSLPAAKGQPHEARCFWPQPLPVVGQPPPHDVARAAQGLCRAWPQDRLPRMRSALVRPAPRSRRSGLVHPRLSTNAPPI